MAEGGNLITVNSNQILFNTLLRSVFWNIINKNWQSEFEMGHNVAIPTITTNTEVDNPADRDELEQGPEAETADLGTVMMERELIRGMTALNKLDLIESGGGMDIESFLNEDLAKNMALNFDKKLYDAIMKDADFTNNVNSFKVGSNTVYIDRETYQPDGTDAIELVSNVVKRVKIAMRRANLLGGDSVGMGAPSAATVVLPVELANVVVDDLGDRGIMQFRGDIGDQAVAELGIRSMDEWEGYAYGCDFMTSEQIPVPAAGADWMFPIIPNGAPITAAYQFLEYHDEENPIDTSAPTAGHVRGPRYVKTRTGWARFGVKKTRVNQVFRGVIESEDS